MASSEDIANGGHIPAELWLGFDLIAPFELITAVLAYQPAWDRRIVQAYGYVPDGIQAIVMLSDGKLLPSRRSLDDLHARWTAWQHDSQSASEVLDTETSQQLDDQL